MNARRKKRAHGPGRAFAKLTLSPEQIAVLDSVYDAIEHAQAEGFSFQQLEWAVKLAWHLATQDAGKA